MKQKVSKEIYAAIDERIAYHFRRVNMNFEKARAQARKEIAAKNKKIREEQIAQTAIEKRDAKIRRKEHIKEMAELEKMMSPKSRLLLQQARSINNNGELRRQLLQFISK